MRLTKNRLMYNFRGVYEESLTSKVAYFAGFNAGVYYKKNKQNIKIVVANDHRYSSTLIKHYVVRGLLDSGCNVDDYGLVPTSIVAYLTKKHADGGCVITASHNPPDYNGIKFFENEGNVLSPAVEEKLIKKTLEDAETKDIEILTPLKPNYNVVDYSGINEYIEDIFSYFSIEKPLNITVDCRYGMSLLIMPLLLEKLGCNVNFLHATLNPYFTSKDGFYVEPEPKFDNISEVKNLVFQTKSDIGLVFDGDADRLILVDNKGNYVLDDYTLLLLCLEYGNQETPRVITIDSSLILKDFLEDRGFKVIVTPVGDSYVWEGIKKSGAEFGGVPNGHYIFPDHCGYSEGIFSALNIIKIVSKLAKDNITFSDLINCFPKTYMIRAKYPYGKTQKDFQKNVAPIMKNFFQSKKLKVDFLQIDDSVVYGTSHTEKLLVRYNRWDNKFNLQSESITSIEIAENNYKELISIIEGCCK